jgi:hypothetical protein
MKRFLDYLPKVSRYNKLFFRWLFAIYLFCMITWYLPLEIFLGVCAFTILAIFAYLSFGPEK